MTTGVRLRGGMSPRQRRELIKGLLFISPWIIGLLLFTLYPLLSSLYYSFCNYDLMGEPTFIGARNYARLFTSDRTFPIVVKNTLWWVVIAAPLGVVSALLMAMLLNGRVLARSFFRAIFFFPSIVPAVVTAVVWGLLLNVQIGAINGVIQMIGLKTVPFLSSPELAKPTLALIHCWAQGNAMVIFLASLQEVPTSLYDAALVDGAGVWAKFWHVTLPMISPVILFNLVMALITAFQNFLLPWLLTQGGPNEATEFIAMMIYRNGFAYMRMGKACALSWLLSIAIAALTVVLFRYSGRYVYYGGE